MSSTMPIFFVHEPGGLRTLTPIGADQRPQDDLGAPQRPQNTGSASG
jgi:hypothetical protein